MRSDLLWVTGECFRNESDCHSSFDDFNLKLICRCYGAMRRWSAQHFRATLQGYFLPASIIGMGGYWLAGLWVAAVTHYYLVSLPVTLLAVFLGRAINHRLHGEAFLKYIYLALVGIGALLLVQAITGQL